MKNRNNELPHSARIKSCPPGATRRSLLKGGIAWTIEANIPATGVAGSLFVHDQKMSAKVRASYVPGSARRLSQVTGDTDSTDLPHANDTSRWGVSGTDMGCPVEFKGRLYLLFGDVPTTTPVDLDPICYTTERSMASGNLRIACILKDSGQFSPLTVDGRTLGTNETATGAFSYNDRLYAFVVRGNSKPYSTLVSTADPAVSTAFTAHYDISDPHGRFWQIAPWVVQNSRVPGLPSASGDGLLMWGQSGRAIYLAWMPLVPGEEPPSKTGLRYYSSTGSWTADQSMAGPVVETAGVTQLSVTWLAGPRKWICLYTRASIAVPEESIVARIGENPWTWSDEIIIFNPDREKAWGRYMHKRGQDSLNTLYPPRDAKLPGYAYSPFLLNRYTTWNSRTQRLVLTYLMATFVPYQVMLMQSTLQMDSSNAVAARQTTQEN